MVASNSSSAVMIARSWLAHMTWPCAGVWFMLRTYCGLSERLVSTGAEQVGTGALAYLVSGTARRVTVPSGLVTSTQCGACGVSYSRKGLARPSALVMYSRPRTPRAVVE